MSEHIVPYPSFLNKPIELVVNDHKVVTQFHAAQWLECWRPLLMRLIELWHSARNRRVLVAIAGPPGSGKSVLAAQLNYLVGKGFFHCDARADVLSMDGFHFSNEYLATHFRTLADGTQIPLALVKGQCDTFDAAAMRQRLKLLAARPASMDWPGYSRELHDVIPDAHTISAATNLVFIDGIYLLLNRGEFAGIPPLFDLRIFLDAPAGVILSNLMERHIRGGKTVQEAKEWVKRNDLHNAQIAEATRANADVIIRRNSAGEMTEIHWKGKKLENTETSPR